MASDIKLERVTGSHPDFVKLVKYLDQDLARRDGDDYPFYAQFNGLDGVEHAIVLRLDNQPIAIGAFKPHSENTLEVKRMFTLPEYRGEGWAVKVLEGLEKWATELGYKKFILETGKRQPEAIHLYEKLGYNRIENYPPYDEVPNSVCFEKRLS